jgi:hypothetical protein
MRLIEMLGATGLLLSAYPSPSSSAPLKPTAAWKLNYGDTQCTASNSFGDPASPVALGIIPSIGGENYALVVNVQHPGPSFAKEAQGTVDFGRGPIKTWLIFYAAKGTKTSNYQFRIPAAEFEQARTATVVNLSTNDGRAFSFALTDMPGLIDALGKCTADLQQYWNMSQQYTAAPSNAQKGDVRTLFSSDDYPSEALTRTQDGTSQFRVLVDEKGSVAGCDVLKQSGVPILDVMGCQVLKERAKFVPATDARGRAIRSVITTPPVTWRLAD